MSLYKLITGDKTKGFVTCFCIIGLRSASWG